MQTQASASSNSISNDDSQYDEFLRAVRNHFVRTVFASALDDIPLFTTTATGLYDVFLNALPAERRQHYNCRACRHFVERFGGLVVVQPDGQKVSALWDADEAPPFFFEPVQAMARAIGRASIDGVFLSEEKVWGLPENEDKKLRGTWRHMHVHSSRVFRATALKNADQAMAEKREERLMLARGLADFPLEVVKQAHALLTSVNLYRSEKCCGVAKWLLDLHESFSAARTLAHRQNLIWRAAATAPAGYCHVRSSMIGTLLEDIQAGLPFADIKRRFDEKMSPLQYQRPQVAPSAGNLAQAEKIVAELKTAGALDRRFAKLEDVAPFARWMPKPAKPEPAKAGVFGHLKPKGAESAARPVEQPPVVMTWEKFAKTVLPMAERIDFLVPMQGPFMGLVTAVNPDAPPILQWDSEERRCPVSWYFYSNGGSTASRWNLLHGTFCSVTAVVLQPTMWHGEEKFSQFGKKVFFLLEGAKDTLYTNGSGFFPEFLRSEYRAVRATMEAYAENAVVVGKAGASACGIGLQVGVVWSNFTFRVTAKGVQTTYILDRWD